MFLIEFSQFELSLFFKTFILLYVIITMYFAYTAAELLYNITSKVVLKSVLSGFLVYGLLFNFNKPTNLVEKYSKNILGNYVMDGFDLYSLNSQTKKLNEVSIDKETKDLIGRVRCGKLSLKSCILKINENKDKLALNQEKIIDVANFN